MRKLIDDERLMVKICDLYYNKNVTQNKIANIFKLSRPTVSRLLITARERGIVKVEIENIEDSKYIDLEMKLETIYSLKDVIIVDTIDPVSAQKEEAGKAAAKYLETLLKDEDTVGISMGSTLATIPKYIKKRKPKNLVFIPLMGGMGHVRNQLHSNYIAQEMAEKFDGNYILMHSPARVSSMELKSELLKEEGIKRVIKMLDRLDVALVGIGAPEDESVLIATGYYKKEYMGSLKTKEVAGDICMQFYDVKGKTTPYKNDSTVIGVDIRKLKKVPYTIGVACGIKRKNAIIGAIKGKYINTLITDIETAKELEKAAKRS